MQSNIILRVVRPYAAAALLKSTSTSHSYQIRKHIDTLARPRTTRESHSRHTGAPPLNRYKTSVDESSRTKSETWSEDDSFRWSRQSFNNENDYIYKYIHQGVHEKFFEIGDLVQGLPVNQYIVTLREMTRAKNPNEHQIGDICTEIKNQIQYMNQLELTSLLTAIKQYDSPQFREIMRQIDMELRWLLKKHVKTRLMDIDLWLYIADTFYECRIQSRFTHVLVNYFTNEPDVEMTNRQILHMLFLLVFTRHQSTLLAKYESRIFKLLNNASFEDLAIICMAYFKTRTKIMNHELLKSIINLTTDNLTTLDPSQPGYGAIVKAIRYSSMYKCREDIMHMILTLTEDSNHRVIFASPFNAVQTVKLMEAARIYDPKLLDMLRYALFDNLEEFRIKDIQYALTSLSNFAYRDLKLDNDLRRDFKKLARNITNEKRPDVAFQYYHLMPILRALSMFQFYDDDLTTYANQVLADEGKFNEMKSVLEFEKSTLVAYVSTHIDDAQVKLTNTSGILKELESQIHRPDIIGSAKQDFSLAHLDFLLRGHSIKKSHRRSSLFHQIAKSLAETEELKDPIYRFYFQHTFPHQNYSDLIITKSLHDIGPYNPHTLLPRRVPSDGSYCMIFATQITDFMDGHSRLSGYKQTIIRLSNKLGYKVLLIDLDEPDIRGVAGLVKSALNLG